MPASNGDPRSRKFGQSNTDQPVPSAGGRAPSNRRRDPHRKVPLVRRAARTGISDMVALFPTLPRCKSNETTLSRFLFATHWSLVPVRRRSCPLKILLLLALLLRATAQANDLLVSVKEETKPPAATSFRINTQSLRGSRTKPSESRVLPQVRKYTIANWQLSTAGRPLTKATEVLFQTTADGADFVVIRDEYNSWFGPLNLLLLLASHPVQVSRIAIVKVASGRLVAHRQLIRKEASYNWTATISQ